MTYALHDYQVVAREFLRGRDRAGLFLDMGLGKTAVCLTALEDRHLPALVVAPKRVAENVWSAEKAIWRPDLTLSVAAGSPAERASSLQSDVDIHVLGRDNVRDLEHVKRKTPFRTLIIDELSGYKSHASVRYKTARKLIARDSIIHVWGLTGTPSPNGYLDLWSQIALLDQGARLGKNITTYRNRYFMPGRQIASGVIVEWNIRPESEDNIKELISDICLSMATDGRIDLPEVTINKVEVELPDNARKAYKEMKAQLLTEINDLLGPVVHTAGNAAILTSKLSQISAGFMFVDDADLHEFAFTVLHDEKAKALQEIADETGSPLLVFYRFRPELALLKEAFPKARLITEPGAIQDWNDGKVPMMFAHPASAGHGLNLQHGGHTAVWTSLPWSLEEWEQANKRLHRQGQQHPVVIHTLLANRSIDHLILSRLRDKAEVQDDLMEHLESPI